MKYLILGAGISGLSASYHLGHERCYILEKSSKPYGHCSSEFLDGYVWDEGPHVLFTNDSYVSDLLTNGIENKFQETKAKIGNYFYGNWIDHPAQVNLYQVPEPLRSECLESFLDSFDNFSASSFSGDSYENWLSDAFGKKFAGEFSGRYTRKYWTVSASELSTKWLKERIYRPNKMEVEKGADGPLDESRHYITTIKYPTEGGFECFFGAISEGANIDFNSEVASINLSNQYVMLEDGRQFWFDKLVSTIPLPTFVYLCEEATSDVKEAADRLVCTELVLVNIEVPEIVSRPESWFYVYDDNMYSTRVCMTESLSKFNTPDGCSGIQVEVYFSKYKPLNITLEEIAEEVIQELIVMKILDKKYMDDNLSYDKKLKYHTKYIPWANVVFDLHREVQLNNIFSWLTEYGLIREQSDLDSVSDWDKPEKMPLGTISFAGRFAEWKYYWSDDCILRGRELGRRVGSPDYRK